MREKDQIEKNDTEYDEARLEETLDIFMQMRAVDKAKGYRKIVEPVNRRARRRQFILLSRYAAVIVVIVVVGIIWGVRGRVDHAVPVIQVQEITPGEMKAKLILATGKCPFRYFVLKKNCYSGGRGYDSKGQWGFNL